MKVAASFLIACSCLAHAQSALSLSDSLEVQKKLPYFFTVRSGAIVGCRDCGERTRTTFAASTIHGVRLRERWNLGLGTGYFSYSGWETMPFFGSASVDLGRKKNKLFFEFNYGYSKAWLNLPEWEEFGFKKAKGGRMVQPTVGYKIAYHDLRISLVAGYHYQRVQRLHEYPNLLWSNGNLVSTEPNWTETTQIFNRFLIQIGVGWK